MLRFTVYSTVLIVLTGLVNLGSCLYEVGQYEECVVNLVSALSSLREVEPTSHYTADGRNAFYVVWCLCLSVYIWLLLMMTVALYWLGLAYMKLNKLKDSEQHLNECLRLQRAIFPRGHKEITASETLFHIKIYRLIL